MKPEFNPSSNVMRSAMACISICVSLLILGTVDQMFRDSAQAAHLAAAKPLKLALSIR